MVDGAGRITHITTSSNGLVSVIRDPSAARLVLRYDPNGRLVSSSGPDGQTTRFERHDRPSGRQIREDFHRQDGSAIARQRGGGRRDRSRRRWGCRGIVGRDIGHVNALAGAKQNAGSHAVGSLKIRDFYFVNDADAGQGITRTHGGSYPTRRRSAGDHGYCWHGRDVQSQTGGNVERRKAIRGS